MNRRCVAVFVAFWAGAAFVGILTTYWILIGFLLLGPSLYSTPALWWLLGILAIDAIAAIAVGDVVATLNPGDPLVVSLALATLAIATGLIALAHLRGPELILDLSRCVVVLIAFWWASRRRAFNPK